MSNNRYVSSQIDISDLLNNITTVKISRAHNFIQLILKKEAVYNLLKCFVLVIIFQLFMHIWQ